MPATWCFDHSPASIITSMFFSGAAPFLRGGNPVQRGPLNWRMSVCTLKTSRKDLNLTTNQPANQPANRPTNQPTKYQEEP